MKMMFLNAIGSINFPSSLYIQSTYSNFLDMIKMVYNDKKKEMKKKKRKKKGI
jgi:hypothetical protein